MRDCYTGITENLFLQLSNQHRLEPLGFGECNRVVGEANSWGQQKKDKTNPVALSPQANHTD
jgi:hypothetical protein